MPNRSRPTSDRGGYGGDVMQPTTGATDSNPPHANPAAPTQVAPTQAVPTQVLPSMRDLDGLEAELNRIDSTLAELDATNDQSTAGA